MFCDEPIRNVWRMQDGFGDEELWEYPDYSLKDEIVYHGLPGFWIVFETEHCYFSVGMDGLKQYVSIEELRCGGREVWRNPVTGIEELVFSGERINSVEEAADGWMIGFDHLQMKVLRHEKSDEYEGPGYPVETPIYWLEHVLKDCICKRKPQFRMDRHGDFYVVCLMCNRYTEAGYDPAWAVNAWNEGRILMK